jgi:hypothetical protein
MDDGTSERAPRRYAIYREEQEDPERAQAVMEILERIRKLKETRIENHN